MFNVYFTLKTPITSLNYVYSPSFTPLLPIKKGIQRTKPSPSKPNKAHFLPLFPSFQKVKEQKKAKIRTSTRIPFYTAPQILNVE